MKIIFLQIDKTQENYLIHGIDIYYQRIKNYANFEILTIQIPKNVRQKTEAEQKLQEAKSILNTILPEDFLIVLDEKGKEYTSEAFAKLMAQKQNASTKRLVFLIGGPFGFDDLIYERANLKMSFSQFTFSHQMIRLFFVEQLYRAFTILKGEKYHHV